MTPALITLAGLIGAGIPLIIWEVRVIRTSL